ncbi:MAG: DUF4350 domain-containing protein [Methanomicrobiales archaeon]|nr:DUF4350 domain-containing protein [Methanomicrobiales archaeon]
MSILKHGSLLTLGVILIAGTVLLLHLSTDYNDYGRYNPGWNGSSRFFESLEKDNVVLLNNANELPGYDNTALLIIAPAGEYSSAEAGYYQDYLERGNTMVVLDDFGSANSLLDQLKSSVRLRNIPLMSADRAYNNPVFIRAYPSGNARVIQNISTLTLDRPSAVDGGSPFLSSSLLSWEDNNGNQRADPNETIGQFVVGTMVQVGNGQLYVIGDPGVIINAMEVSDGAGDRAIFISNILHLRNTTIIDQTHSMTGITTNPSSIIHKIQTSMGIQIGSLAFILMIFVIGFRKQLW